MPQIDTSTKPSQTFLGKIPGSAEKEIWKKAYVKYLMMTNKNPV